MSKIISHRGNNNHNYKENTLNGILDSLNKDYIDGVEFDIRLTKDKKFILSHNTITYESGIIKNKRLNELKKEGLSSLNDVLKKINSNKYIVIDIKYDGSDYRTFMRLLNKNLKKYRHLNIYLSSFNYGLVKYIKNNYNYKTGLIISNILNKNKKYDIFDFISIKYNMYKNCDIEIMIWTVNKIEELNKYVDKDIFIITDKAYLIEKNIDIS